MIGGLWWSLCCDSLWFHGAVAGMFETAVARWWVQNALHAGDCRLCSTPVMCLWHTDGCRMYGMMVIAKFIVLWWLQSSLHCGDCKVHCSVVLIKFMAWWWLQSSLHSKCATGWWLQGVLCVGDCKTFDKPMIAKCVTYWWFQNVWPTGLGKSLCKRQLQEFGISG